MVAQPRLTAVARGSRLVGRVAGLTGLLATAGWSRAAAVSLALHVAVALALWWPFGRGGPAAKTAAREMDLASEEAPRAPEVEVIGRGALARGAGAVDAQNASSLTVALVAWPSTVAATTPEPAPIVRSPRPKPPRAKPAEAAPTEATPAEATPAVAATAAGPGAEGVAAPPAGGLGAGIGAASGNGGGAGVAPVSLAGVGNASFATGANLLAYAPPRHIVAVYVDLAALRGTPWAPLTEAILRPLPDYGVLLGGVRAARGLSLFEGFDALFISSSSPRRVDATLVAARARISRADLQAALASGASEGVAWSEVRGGVVGVRGGGDGRVFFSPDPAWMMLARSRELGDLLAPNPAASRAADAATAEPPATAVSPAMALPSAPTWLAQLMVLGRHIAYNTPPDANPPVLMMTAQVKPSATWSEVLGAPDVPLPAQLTASWVLDRTGFLVRGNLVFADEAAAAAFRTALVARQASVIADPVASVVLGRLGAKNALLNFKVAQTERVLAISTSISAVDAKKLLGLAALELVRYFNVP